MCALLIIGDWSRLGASLRVPRLAAAGGGAGGTTVRWSEPQGNSQSWQSHTRVWDLRESLMKIQNFFFFFYIFYMSYSVAERWIDRVVTGVLNKYNGNKHNIVCYAYTSKFLLVWICANISGEHSIFSTVTHYHSYKCQPGMQLTSVAANPFWEWILHKLSAFC